MVAFASLFDAIESHQHSIGFFEHVTKHEPKSAPDHGLTASTWLQDVRPVQARSGLSATSIRIEFTTRIYHNMLAQPEDEIDTKCFTAIDVLFTAYTGDFTLGGQISHVDILGAHGEPLRARGAYLNQSGTLYRVYDIITPLIVNDAWPQAA